MKRTILFLLAALAGSILLSSCSATAREKRAEKRERKKWKDDGKTRWQKWQEWEKKKGDEMWDKFKDR